MKKQNEKDLELSDEEVSKKIRRSLDSALETVRKNKKLNLENFQEFISLYGLDGYLELQSPSQPCWSKGKQTKIPITRPSERGLVSYLVYSTPKGEKEAIKIIVHDLLVGGHLNLGKIYFLTHFLLKQRKYSKLAGTIANLLYLYNGLLETKVSKDQRYKMVNESDYGRYLPELKKLFKSREVYREVVKYFSEQLGDFLYTREESKHIDYDNLSFQKELRQTRKPVIPQRKRGYNDKGHLPDPTKPKIDLEECSNISDHETFWSEYIRNVQPEFKDLLRKFLKEAEKKTSKEDF
jgi:hypothetical protein